MSSSLARSRSLRKPSASTTTASSSTAEPAPSANDKSKEADRHASPSRLPVKPLTRVASTSTKGSGIAQRTSRTASSSSGVIGRTASTRQQQPPSESGPRREAATSRYPPSTTTTRTTSVTRPTSSGSGQPSQVRRAPTHTRAKSTVTATTLQPSTTLRPPSQGSRPASTSTTRNASNERGVKSYTTTNTSTTATNASSKARSNQQQSSQPASAAAAASQPRLRPAFSTLQQHYSPAKTRDPKPLMSTYLVPPSPSKLPANVASSAETSRLQAELLQLHLVHRDAAAVEAQWRASAREKLGQRFDRLKESTREVAEEERAGLERINVLALRSWAGGGGGGGLEERIQGLDEVVNGVWALSEPGGRYARLVRKFERWLGQVREVEEARGSGSYMTSAAAAAAAADDQVLFVSELDASWKEDCPGIYRRLDGWRRQLRDMGQLVEDEAEEKSSLGRMLEGSRALVNHLLTAVNLMEEIEQDAIAKEDRWIEKMNREEDDNDDTPKAGAIWRLV